MEREAELLEDAMEGKEWEQPICDFGPSIFEQLICDYSFIDCWARDGAKAAAS